MTSTISRSWLAARTAGFDSSGIRKVFDLAAKMANPINLSIGQPDFDVPKPVQDAAIHAIQSGRNGYSQTQGIGPLREAIQQSIDTKYGHADRRVLITSGTSGALVLAMMAMVDPGDEVIFFDPYFVMYPALVRLAGGVPVVLDTYPDFRIDAARVEAAITPRTKLIIANSPANPTGVTATAKEMKELADVASRHQVALISDEIYSLFCYDDACHSPATYDPRTIVIDGFSKSHAMTGWRCGWVHGPAEIIDAMAKLQQYTFVCAPQPAQWAGLAALPYDMSTHRKTYQAKRDMMVRALQDHYQLIEPGGAFYLFPKVPWGNAQSFVETAIANELLIIPGSIFSKRDTHFRISYAASDETLHRGIEVLQRIARPAP
jgi:aspartate/methionine/tyrosine aminotransferase